MSFICEQELLEIYQRVDSLFKGQGLAADIALIRDYLLKIKVSDKEKALGKLIVDYSPKKGTHSYRRDTDLSEEQFNRLLKILGAVQPPKNQVKTEKKPASEKKTPPNVQKDTSHIPYHAYVDGSFIEGNVGYGAVILEQGTIVAEISGLVDSPDAFNSRQVGGEIQAVLEVLKWCDNKGIDQIAIFYDFQNIEKWATGEYRTNTPMTQAYKKAIDQCKISITWVKVESHTGVALNDRADELAKNGARQLGAPAGQDAMEQMSLFGMDKPRTLRGWIIYNGSLVTPKYTEQVEMFVAAAQRNNIVLEPYTNDTFGAAVINGELTLIPGRQPPDFVLFWDKDVRLARHLELMGIKLFNSAEAIALCDDKILTHQVLANEGIPMPKTIFSPLLFPVCPVDEGLFIDKVEKTLAYPVVVKEAFGSFGAQVYLARNREELLSLRRKLVLVPHLYQEYIHTSHGRDVRLQVVGDEVVAATMRTSETDFRANASVGGKMVPFIPSMAFSALAVKATKLVGACFAGVDILFGPSDEPILCEINSNAHIKNLFEHTGVDVADRMMSYIKRQLI